MHNFKQLVDETVNIKNELVRCHTDLKNNLIDKGVEVTDSDKMSNLIGKVNSINTRKYGVSFFKPIYSIPETKYDNTSTYSLRAEYIVRSKDKYIDCVRMTSKVRRYYSNSGKEYNFYLAIFINDELYIELNSDVTKEYVVETKVDSRLLALKNGDIIKLKTKSDSNSGYIEFLLEFGYASENLAD